MDTSKRELLAGLGLLGMAALAQPAAAQPTFEPNRNRKLVCVYLRGGADALNLVVPYGDSNYYNERPAVAIAANELVAVDDSRVYLNGAAAPYRNHFGLHPQFASMASASALDDTAFVLATGGHHDGRSHFAGQALMESGRPAVRADRHGWLGRWLKASASAVSGNASLRAIAIGANAPLALNGGTPMVMPDISRFGINYRGREEIAAALSQSYSDCVALKPTADALLDADAVYDDAGVAAVDPVASGEHFRHDLRQVAALIKAGVGEVYSVDMHHWDTHADQRSRLDELVSELSSSLAEFRSDMFAAGMLDDVTVVVMSEFGRRVRDNGSGTDHGTGGLMMVMGGGVRGGLYGDWPGVIPAEGTQDILGRPYRGDLLPTLDYRNVLGEVLKYRMTPAVAPGQVFPEYSYDGDLGFC